MTSVIPSSIVGQLELTLAKNLETTSNP